MSRLMRRRDDRRIHSKGDCRDSDFDPSANPRVFVVLQQQARYPTKQTSNEARGPGEFKHIINRRKRN